MEWSGVVGIPELSWSHIRPPENKGFEMNLEIINSGEPLSEEDLREMEDELGVRLPRDYREFMLAHNGGEFDILVDYPLIDPPWRGTGGFREFCDIRRDTRDGGLYGIGDIPDPPMEGLVFFADDETGFLCLCCEGEDYGKVYFADFDRGLSKWFCLVANSFTEFLESIHPRKDEE